MFEEREAVNIFMEELTFEDGMKKMPLDYVKPVGIEMARCPVGHRAIRHIRISCFFSAITR